MELLHKGLTFVKWHCIKRTQIFVQGSIKRINLIPEIEKSENEWRWMLTLWGKILPNSILQLKKTSFRHLPFGKYTRMLEGLVMGWFISTYYCSFKQTFFLFKHLFSNGKVVPVHLNLTFSMEVERFINSIWFRY